MIWVDGELSQEFAGDGVHDPGVEVLDEQNDVGSGVGSADADVVHLSRVRLCGREVSC